MLDWLEHRGGLCRPAGSRLCRLLCGRRLQLRLAGSELRPELLGMPAGFGGNGRNRRGLPCWFPVRRLRGGLSGYRDPGLREIVYLLAQQPGQTDRRFRRREKYPKPTFFGLEFAREPSTPVAPLPSILRLDYHSVTSSFFCSCWRWYLVLFILFVINR